MAQAPSLDGRVADDPAWQAVPALTDFWQTAPDAGQPASERTEVRIAYTEDALYFGVTLFDRSTEGLTVSDSRRDSPLDDVDSFRILLDTYKDRQNGFVFATNPAALEYDGQVIGEGGMVLGGGGGRRRPPAGRVGRRLQPELGRRLAGPHGHDRRRLVGGVRDPVPHAALRARGRARVGRQLPAHDPPPQGVRLLGAAPLPVRSAEGVAGRHAGRASTCRAQRNLKLIPYALGEIRERGAATSRTTALGDVGLDAKYGLTPSLTLDATVNTDFAQVEVDEQQINLDRFNLFFPEKRPFFLENAGLFAVGAPGEAEVFFSRRIGIADDRRGDPDPRRRTPVRQGGTGERRAAQHADRRHGHDGRRTTSRWRACGATSPTARTWARSSWAATPPATRRCDDDHNASFAVDGRWGIGRTGLISGFAARSATPGVSGDQHAYQIGARNETQPLTLNVALTETGRNFNPEVGFLSRQGGFRKFEALAFSRLRPKSLSKFQEIRPHSIYRGYWNPVGLPRDRLLAPRRALGAEERLGVPHRRERHA